MDMSKMNHVFNETGEIGGIAYLLANLAVYLPYTVLYGLASVCGIMGNMIIFATIICNKELHNITGMLIFNLSLADIIVSGFVDSFTVVGTLVGQSFFHQNSILCGFIASFCLVACITSLMNIGFLAFNRFIHICYHHHYAAMFTVKKTIVYCVITWLVGCLITIPNLTGWGGYRYDTKTLECLWNRLASQSYSIFFPMSSIVLPCLCILYFYIRIFIFVRQSNKRVNQSSNHNQSARLRSRELKKSIKLAKGLFASFMLFTICWLPYGMIVMLDFEDKLPPAVHAYSMAIAHFNSSLNPVLYAVANPAFQKGYRQLFSTLILRREAIVPTNKTSRSRSQIFNNNNNSVDEISVIYRATKTNI